MKDKTTHELLKSAVCGHRNRHHDFYRELRDLELPLTGGSGRQYELRYDTPKPN